jgi:iron-sulfur cluster repair protein YtfE (RIC family)
VKLTWWQVLGVVTVTAAAGAMTTGFVREDAQGHGAAKGAGGALAPLHEEHEMLLPHIDALREAGDAVGTATPAQLQKLTREAHTFLTDHLIPHAQAEDKVLYPEVDRVLGGVPATATMVRDHIEVGRYTEQLAELEPLTATALTDAQAGELRHVLYGVHAIVRLHFAKEEEVYVPLLERELTEAEAKALIEHLHEAEQTSGHAEEHGAGH